MIEKHKDISEGLLRRSSSTRDLQKTLLQWYAFIKSKSKQDLLKCLSEDIEFHSPFVYKAKKGVELATWILTNVVHVVKDIEYHREFFSGDTFVIEFSGKIEGLNLKGVDIAHVNEDGKIDHLEVMIRPHNALGLLGKKMEERLKDSSQ